jgi:DNA invertase Pin-like site-specific DNA recombinase
MIYGYIRVSTDKQNSENQKFEIAKYLKRNNLPEKVIWIEETVSGTKNHKKRILGKYLEEFGSSDTLIVSELSRLGRSLFDVMTILNDLITKKVQVISIKEKFELKDDINSQVLAFAFSLSAQIERQLISQRTKEALARVKSEGKILGRPPGRTSTNKKLAEHHNEIIGLLKKQVSKSAIARIYEVNRATLKKYIDEHIDNKKHD